MFLLWAHLTLSKGIAANKHYFQSPKIKFVHATRKFDANKKEHFYKDKLQESKKKFDDSELNVRVFEEGVPGLDLVRRYQILQCRI